MGLFDGKKFDLQSAVGKIQGKIADIAQTTESANVKTDSAPNDNLGKIMFCSNCGTKLNSDAKFCHGCGTAIQGKQEAQVIPSVQMQSVPPIPPQSNNSERQQEYVEQNEPNKIESSNARQNDFVGNVKKCPACGAELSSFTAICPTCGHEINSVSGSNSIKDFSERIDEYDRQISASSIKSKGGWSAWSTNLRIGWVVLNIYTFCIPLLVRAIINLIRFFMPKLSPQEKIKTAFIENYHFPNEKEAIVEALLFIKTKMLFMESDTDKYSLHWSRVWSNKAAQLYQKADTMFHGDKISEEAYFTIKQCQTKIKKKRILVPIITIASIFLAISILCVSCGIRHSNVNSNDVYNQSIESNVVDDANQPSETNMVNAYVIEKGTEYTYMSDEWNLYVATAISDRIVKIENWGKTLSSSKTVDYKYDVGTYKINDEINAFSWLDNEHTAFAITIQDKKNSRLKKAKSIFFTLSDNNGKKFKGSNYNEKNVCYSMQNDDWHLYRAIPLTPNIIKIEAWGRTSSLDSFVYGYDVCLLDLNNTATDFEWADDEHTAFTITMQDSSNKFYWKEKHLVSFVNDSKH